MTTCQLEDQTGILSTTNCCWLHLSRCCYCWEQELLPFTLLAFLCCQSHNWIFRLTVTCLFATEPDSRCYIGCAGAGSYIHRCRISEHPLYGNSHSFSPLCLPPFAELPDEVSTSEGPGVQPCLGNTEAARVLLLRFWLSGLLVRPVNLSLLTEGLHHRTELWPNRPWWDLQPPGSHCCLWHPAGWTMQNAEASKCLLVQTQFRCHEVVVMYCARFGWGRDNFLPNADVMVWFGFMLETVLVTHRCFCYCLAGLTQRQGLFFSSHTTSECAEGTQGVVGEHFWHSWPLLTIGISHTIWHYALQIKLGKK